MLRRRLQLESGTGQGEGLTDGSSKNRLGRIDGDSDGSTEGIDDGNGEGAKDG